MNLTPRRNGIQEDAWTSLRSFTNARIALGKTGAAIPLREVLQFRMAHAHARDAVFSELAMATLQNELEALGRQVYLLRSKASGRNEYLQRPDLGRSLDDESVNRVDAIGEKRMDIALVLADGLSASAVNTHAVPLLQQLTGYLEQANYSISPVCLVQQGRVAIADEIGSLLQAKLSLILIGERPGLSSSESLGAYLTYNPRPGLTDEARNCISNIHENGLSYEMAAEKILYLIRTAFSLRLSGVKLKEERDLLL